MSRPMTRRNARIRRLAQQGVSPTAIARRLGVCRERVNQIISPVKYRARDLVKKKIRRGTMRRAAVCEVCGKRHPRIEIHHRDYERPLDVVQACRPCHREIHREVAP